MADALLHVVDAAHPQALEQVATVEKVLEELGRDTGAMISVLNKCDALGEESELEVLRAKLPRSVVVSAKTGEGLEELAALIADEVRSVGMRLSLRAPAGAGRLIAFVRSHAELHGERHDDDVWIADFTLRRALLGQLRRLLVGQDDTTLIELD